MSRARKRLRQNLLLQAGDPLDWPIYICPLCREATWEETHSLLCRSFSSPSRHLFQQDATPKQAEQRDRETPILALWRALCSSILLTSFCFIWIQEVSYWWQVNSETQTGPIRVQSIHGIDWKKHKKEKQFWGCEPCNLSPGAGGFHPHPLWPWEVGVQALTHRGSHPSPGSWLLPWSGDWSKFDSHIGTQPRLKFISLTE